MPALDSPRWVVRPKECRGVPSDTLVEVSITAVDHLFDLDGGVTQGQLR
jgi:hypothetical protein